MTIDFRYARIGLIAGLACFGSVSLAKPSVLPKDSAVPANDHGKSVSSAAKDGTKGTELAELAKKKEGGNGNGNGHGNGNDHEHDGHGHDGEDHGHGHPRSPH